MRGEQAIFNLEIKKKSGLSINPDIHHSKVFSSGRIFSIVVFMRILDTDMKDDMPVTHIPLFLKYLLYLVGGGVNKLVAAMGEFFSSS